METVNVSSLKNNPSEALRMARQDVVVVMNRDRPDALLVGIEAAGVLEAAGVRPALATALFRAGELSLVRATRLVSDSCGAVRPEPPPPRHTRRPTGRARDNSSPRHP